MSKNIVNRDDVRVFLALAKEMAGMPRWPAAAGGAPYEPSLKLQVNRTRRPIGRFASRKMNVHMPYVSSLERDFCYLMETSPSVSAYLTQPGPLRYLHDDEVKTHLPDVLMLKGDRRLLLEVKYDDDAAREKVRRRTEWLTAALAPHGIAYRLVRESAIRIQPRLRWARLLSRFRWHEPHPQVLFLVEEFLRKHEAVPLRDIAMHLEIPPDSQFLSAHSDPKVEHIDTQTALAAETALFAGVLRGHFRVREWRDPLSASLICLPQ